MDLDDLLGGGATKDLDDLLGGGGGSPSGAPSAGNATATFSDDLLFGDAPSSAGAAPPTTTAAAPSSPSKVPMSPGARSPTTPGGSSSVAQPKVLRKVKPINVPKFSTEVPVSLKPFVNDSTYFARWITVIDKNRNRKRRVLTVTDTQLCIMDDEAKVERSEAVYTVIGILIQNRKVTKALSKVEERHMILQFQAEGDLYFSFHKDEGNPPPSSLGPIVGAAEPATTGAQQQATSSSTPAAGAGSAVTAAPPQQQQGFLDLVPVLSAIVGAYNITLPVSILKDAENLDEMVHWIPIDFRVRRQLTEALAYRTELLSESAALQKQFTSLDLAIYNLKNSTAGQAAADMLKEISTIRETMGRLSLQIDSLKQTQASLEKGREDIRLQLAAEATKRQAAVKTTMAGSAKNELMRQVAGYECLKAAHKREMDRIAALTQFLEERGRNRKAESYAGPQLSLRIEDLEEEWASLQNHMKGNDKHARRIKALAEGKKRVALGKEYIEALKQDVAVLKATPVTSPLPSHFVVDREATVPLGPLKEDTVVLTEERSSGGGGGGGGLKGPAPPVVVDDDDDDLVVVAPKTVAASSGAKAPPISLDDDDI